MAAGRTLLPCEMESRSQARSQIEFGSEVKLFFGEVSGVISRAPCKRRIKVVAMVTLAALASNELPFARQAWLIFLAVNTVNAFVLKFRSQAYIRERPELAPSYQKLFRGILFWGSLPWLVLGIGMVSGGVQNMNAYFRPRTGNPFVLAWYGVVVALWILGGYWLFARRGAEFLVEHRGLIQGSPQNPTSIRLFYCVILVAGVAGMVLAFAIDFPRV